MDKIVSIIIPSYNSEKYICQAVESAISQSWSAKEIIVVDDGSQDKTCEIVSKFTKYGVHLFQRSHQGACAARNFGVEQAVGEYIQFLDSDDILLKDKISSQMPLLTCDTVVPFCSIIGFNDGDDIAKIKNPEKEKSEIVLFPKTLLKKMINTSSMLISRKLFMENGGFDEKLKRAQEHDLTARLSARGIRFFFDGTHQVLIRHHASPHRISNLSPISCWDSDLYFLERVSKYAELYLKTHSGTKDEVLNELISLNIFFAQQLGNFGEYATCKSIEGRLRDIRRQFRWNKMVHYKAGKLYNCLLNMLGITNFERMRHFLFLLRKRGIRY